MTRKFKNVGHRCREVYTPPYDLAHLARIIHNGADEWDKWNVYLTIGCSGNYIFGPYRVEINTSNGMWRIQSAETIYELRTGEGRTEAEGDLQDCSPKSIHTVLKKVDYK